MSKRLWMAMVLALGVVLLMPGLAGAAKYLDLTGTWTGTCVLAWNDDFGSGNIELTVDNQDANGMFYGTWNTDYPLSGGMATNKEITAAVGYIGGGGPYPNAVYMIIKGKLTGKKIQGTFVRLNEGGVTGKFELTKQVP